MILKLNEKLQTDHLRLEIGRGIRQNNLEIHSHMFLVWSLNDVLPAQDSYNGVLHRIYNAQIQIVYT